MANSSSKHHVGVDVGGTKIAAALVKETGEIVARKKRKTPRDSTNREVLKAITETIEELLDRAKPKRGRKLKVSGLGLAVPGIVDDKRGRVVVAPNIALAGLTLTTPLERKFDAPVVLGNDVDLGTLGETWMGAAKGASSAVGVFVGTGIGGGVVLEEKLWRGRRGYAGEIGHMTLDLHAKDTGFMTKGSFESLASRTAIEARLRAAIANGEKSKLSKILDNDLTLIKSGSLAKALDANDPLTKKVMAEASEVIGHAIVTLRRILDPERFILGGGVAEACGKFMLPIIDEVVRADPHNPKGTSNVKLSRLGDDAVILGAVALSMQALGKKPIG